ncbi:hypothetical protein [Ligilactobacillus sp. LYQ60]|uniref:hypothetical protein n=1 Tax=unclassified Ligilactobacillus TaxID=2767920 RepID=UPI003854C97F
MEGKKQRLKKEIHALSDELGKLESEGKGLKQAQEDFVGTFKSVLDTEDFVISGMEESRYYGVISDEIERVKRSGRDTINKYDDLIAENQRKQKKLTSKLDTLTSESRREDNEEADLNGANSK